MTVTQLYHFMAAAFLVVAMIISGAMLPPSGSENAAIQVVALLSTGFFALVNLYSALKPFVKQESEDKANSEG
ncbi:hypothetical protein [Vibrio vulnificus]|nr:hypothetical protein [Vibrio vulnificus]